MSHESPDVAVGGENLDWREEKRKAGIEMAGFKNADHSRGHELIRALQGFEFCRLVTLRGRLQVSSRPAPAVMIFWLDVI